MHDCPKTRRNCHKSRRGGAILKEGKKEIWQRDPDQVFTKMSQIYYNFYIVLILIVHQGHFFVIVNLQNLFSRMLHFFIMGASDFFLIN